MDTISLPTKIETSQGTKPNESLVTIEPLYPGYGHTIGVALRRVLLSSLEGGAAVAVKIKGVGHEFSNLPYVKEDVVDIILNLKRLRFRVFSQETVKLVLKVRGEKVVTGADVEGTTEAEIASPNAVICTLTNKNAQLEMEIFVKKGKGYLPTEAREKEKLEIGTIALDALFTPIRTVGLSVEDVRVGQMTNYNKVIMNIETDGSISAEDALKNACSILVEQFGAVGTLVAARSGATDESSSEETFDESSEEISPGEEEALSEEESGDDNSDGEKKEPKKRGRPKKNS
ncbi:MAG: DNA-directed RNA polymerase subunit alpha [Patescibacteria group bacterium]